MIAYDRLSQIVPADQALAAKALATSLQTIAGITNMTLPVLANTVVAMETTNNLALISALTQAVPTSVATYLSNIGGANGRPVGVCDVLGIAAGYQITDNFINTVSTLANTNVANLTVIYQTMNNVVTGVYGNTSAGPVTIPGGTPAAGTYTAVTDGMGNVLVPAADAAITGSGGDTPPTGTGLIPVAQIEIGNIANNSSAQVATLNTYFDSMAAQVAQEQNLQTASGIDFANLVAINNPTVYSLVYNFPAYGRQSEQGGAAQFWEGVANLSTFTGQAVVATLREGKNLAVLGNAGVQTNATVPDQANPPVAQANLIPATYSASAAANSVVS
jgi:hypothetical protein